MSIIVATSNDHDTDETTNSENDLEKSRFRTQNIPGSSNGLRLYFRMDRQESSNNYESSGLRIQVLRYGDPAEPDLYGINIPTSLRGFISLNERREVFIVRLNQSNTRA